MSKRQSSGFLRFTVSKPYLNCRSNALIEQNQNIHLKGTNFSIRTVLQLDICLANVLKKKRENISRIPHGDLRI